MKVSLMVPSSGATQLKRAAFVKMGIIENSLSMCKGT